MPQTPLTDTLPWAPYRRQPAQAPSAPLQVIRPCPLSGSTNDRVVFAIPDFQFYDDQGGRNRLDFKVVQNQDSGFLYTNPGYTPTGLSQLLAKAGQSFNPYPQPARNARRAEWVRQHCPDVRHVVDLGCGMGGFLAALPDTWRKTGYDSDAEMVARAQAHRPEITFVQADFTAQPLPADTDLVTMIQVLEHLPDPVAQLRHLRASAGPNTRLLIEVPLLDFAVDLPVTNLVDFYTPLHLSHFTRNTLMAVFATAGWEPFKAWEMRDFRSLSILATPVTPRPWQPDATAYSTDEALIARYHQLWEANRQRIAACVTPLADASQILVWGAGLHTEYLVHLTELFGPDRRYVLVDSDPLKIGGQWHGIPIVAADALSEEVWAHEAFPVVISTCGGQAQVLQRLQTLQCPSDRIVTLYP